jgi:hypothetical protein
MNNQDMKSPDMYLSHHDISHDLQGVGSVHDNVDIHSFLPGCGGLAAPRQHVTEAPNNVVILATRLDASLHSTERIRSSELGPSLPLISEFLDRLGSEKYSKRKSDSAESPTPLARGILQPEKDQPWSVLAFRSPTSGYTNSVGNTEHKVRLKGVRQIYSETIQPVVVGQENDREGENRG